MTMQANPLKTVLVVDDSPEAIAAFTAVLHRDYRVLIANDGARALDLAQSKRPSIILLDLQMPGLDGHEVCRRLKANPITSDIPVIFVTATRNVADFAYLEEQAGRAYDPDLVAHFLALREEVLAIGRRYVDRDIPVACARTCG
jgi:CheY-like chemotaxis protein